MFTATDPLVIKKIIVKVEKKRKLSSSWKRECTIRTNFL